eukprot:4500817-Prymnesium_polylepis.1
MWAVSASLPVLWGAPPTHCRDARTAARPSPFLWARNRHTPPHERAPPCISRRGVAQRVSLHRPTTSRPTRARLSPIWRH